MSSRALAIVLIGRNEGDRLLRALDAVVGKAAVLVYVDSGSTDGSVAAAKQRGAEVVELDATGGFTAARARNAGFHRARSVAAAVDFVQFIDGDCEVVDGWLGAAERFLQEHGDVAAVCGRRRERYPDRSIYNRLMDLEWDTPVGEATACGGDAMFRVEAFEQVGGFNDAIPAGEEPELCARLRDVGWKIWRLNHEMTLHDADITRFTAWWRREVRTGYGSLLVHRHTKDHHRLFADIVSRTRRWTLGYLLAGALLVGLASWLAGWVGAAATLGLVLLVQPLQALRLAAKLHRRSDHTADGGLPPTGGAGGADARTPPALSERAVTWGDALKLGALLTLAKWAQMQGQLKLIVAQQRGDAATIIEYKRSGVAPTAAPDTRS